MGMAAEVFPPGEFLKEELDARGWSQTEFAEIIGRPVRLINEIISGKRAITPETAIQLGDSLKTGPELWMNLESQYQLSKVRSFDGAIARRASLHERFPIREMIKRGWLQATENVEVLEQQVCRFFGISRPDDEVSFAHAARKAEVGGDTTIAQLAWLHRARNICDQQNVGRYSSTALFECSKQMKALLDAPEKTSQVGGMLKASGVRFLLLEALPGSKIDGACFWLNDSEPAIVLSLRHDRIDNFWFVLRHEMEHVLQGHGKARGFILDQDIDGSDANVDEEERIANDAAADFCVAQDQLTNFMARVSPYFSEQKVQGFSQRMGVHPGVVVGQLQRRLGRYDFLRRHQVRIRSHVTSGAPADGWGLVDVMEG